VYIEGGSGPTGFAVIDGANFYSVSNIMSLNTQVSTNKVKSGIQNGGPDGSGGTGLAFKTISDISIVELDYDDTGAGGSLAFESIGIATSTTTDTVPSSTGVYTETFSARLTAASDGISNGDPFIATLTVSFSGSGELSL
jgi:hypothetical protein